MEEDYFHRFLGTQYHLECDRIIITLHFRHPCVQLSPILALSLAVITVQQQRFSVQ